MSHAFFFTASQTSYFSWLLVKDLLSSLGRVFIKKLLKSKIALKAEEGRSLSCCFVSFPLISLLPIPF